MKIGGVDLDILRELRENSDRPVRELAKKMGLHPNTLLQHIRKMEGSGIIVKYTAEIDYTKLGYDLQALVMIKVGKEVRSDWKVLDELRAFKDVSALYAITGGYDLCAIVKTKNRETLADLLSEINKKPYVVETNTTLMLHAFKHAYEFNPL
jgi:DNA-binding Lrp family transcriptional regulator